MPLKGGWGQVCSTYLLLYTEKPTNRKFTIAQYRVEKVIKWLNQQLCVNSSLTRNRFKQ